jgi:hypothetical protein
VIHLKPLTEEAEWAWFQARANPIACQDSQGIVAYDDNADIMAMAVFDSFTVDACNVHLAIDKPMVLRHGFLEECARHLFVECGCKRIFGIVPGNNAKALKLNKHLGYRQVAVIPDGYADGVDYIIMRMDADNNRWIDLSKYEERVA